MSPRSQARPERPGLLGRGPECERLDSLLQAVRAGESRSVVLRGEAGVGKTALLDYLLEHAPGCRTVRMAAVESEMELAFAALQLLCRPMLDRLDHLPEPQRDALSTVFGAARNRSSRVATRRRPRCATATTTRPGPRAG
jgi:predicted ATPase